MKWACLRINRSCLRWLLIWIKSLKLLLVHQVVALDFTFGVIVIFAWSNLLRKYPSQVWLRSIQTSFYTSWSKCSASCYLQQICRSLPSNERSCLVSKTSFWSWLSSRGAHFVLATIHLQCIWCSILNSRLMKHVKHINLQFHMLREFSKQKEVALTYTFLSKWECWM